jgi:hypothetical protein
MKGLKNLLHKPSLRTVFILLSFFILISFFLLSTASNSQADDTTPPTGSVLINNGSPLTNDPNVVLTLSATDDIGTVTSMQLSNDGVNWNASEPYATTKNWTLSAGEGTKTVYARFSDNAGNWSALPGFSATIVFDATPPSVSSFTKIAAGMNFTLGIKADGSLWAWGANLNGQLGDGTFAGKYSPVQIGKDKTWSTVAAGYTHSVAVATDGTLWTWGSNTYGELGIGSTTASSVPVQVTISGGATWLAADGGNGFSIALSSDHKIYDWGRNNFGQQGIPGALTQHPRSR